MLHEPQTGAQRLRQLLEDPQRLVLCPGVFDGLTARLSLHAGFDALYMTGAGTSMSRLGMPDLGIVSLDDMKSNAEMITSLDPSRPLIADADTGYGGPIMVARTVAQYSRSGVAALHIEDQIQQKRRGHLLGKQIVDREEYYSRLRAAVTTRNRLQSQMLIIARTDARASHGFEEAVERLRTAVDIGVDAVFLEAIASEDEARKLCQIFQKTQTPVLVNVVAGGAMGVMTAAKAKDIGFRIMIVPGICIAALVDAASKSLRHLKEAGGLPAADLHGNVKQIFDICGLQECIKIDEEAGGKAFGDIDDSKR